MDLPTNINALVQMGGRVERVGQKKPPVIEILVTDRTFDVAKQGLMATKYLPLLAGQGGFDLSDIGDMTEEQAINYICEEMLRRSLGQSCSRVHWRVSGDQYIKTLADGSMDPIHVNSDTVTSKEREAYLAKFKKCEKAWSDAGRGLKAELIEKAEASKYSPHLACK